MRKILLIISEYLSRFFSVVLVGGILLLASTFITIPGLWMGGGRSGNVFHNNFGSILLENFEDNYTWFFFFPLVIFAIALLLISVFIWIYYRRDEKTGDTGFKNIILSLLVLFVLIYLPIRINDFRFKISQMKADELDGSGGITKISTPDERRELLDIYHSLYREGLLAWHHDPVKVVKHDLEYGILRPYDADNNELSIEAMAAAVPGVLGSAVVLVKNEKHQIAVHLSGQGSDDDRVWMVYGYEFNKDPAAGNFGNDQIEKAENYPFTNISNWNDIKKAITECEIESVMQTHALEVTAVFKDGREITAQEPEIDDIFDVIEQSKDKCGAIRMATE
jgi:hypothetical protein